MRNVACNLCGENQPAPFFQQRDLWLNRNDFFATFVTCRSCGLIYQNPQPEEAELAAFYPEDYAVYQPKDGYFYRRGMRKRCEVLTAKKPSGTLLDVGCATGEFLKTMRDIYGWKVVGLESSPAAAEQGHQRYNLEILPGSLDDVQFASEMFDAVSLWDVLEHLPDPTRALIEIYRILKPDGTLLLRLPNAGSRDARWFGRYWAGVDAPRHLFLFDRQTLTTMLQKTGFEVSEIRSDIGSYLNFVKSVQFWLTGKEMDPSLSRVILAFLRSLPVRIMAVPFIRWKDKSLQGTALVVTAQKKQPANQGASFS